jgi:hypothetical protein
LVFLGERGLGSLCAFFRPEKSLGFLGFSRPKLAFSMGYERYPHKIPYLSLFPRRGRPFAAPMRIDETTGPPDWQGNVDLSWERLRRLTRPLSE